MNPGTTPELLASLLEVRDTVSDYVRGLSVAQFTAGTDQRWSPAHHLDHLERSNAPVAAGLGLRERLPLAPREQPKRSFEQVQAAYRARLAGAPGPVAAFCRSPRMIWARSCNATVALWRPCMGRCRAGRTTNSTPGACRIRCWIC
ncbi:hypothetical protein ACFSC4_17945 [Deinococcus malanensis]|uniref:hypothetical protein n=1 Tax=Deinococcus malanensis TaxID=1706855 RepID=UPI003629B975